MILKKYFFSELNLLIEDLSQFNHIETFKLSDIKVSKTRFILKIYKVIFKKIMLKEKATFLLREGWKRHPFFGCEGKSAGHQKKIQRTARPE